MALFGDKNTNPPKIVNPINPKWAKAPSGGFNKLLSFDPESANIRDVGGVYIVWHGGVKPAWVYAGETPNLARSINELLDNDDVTQFEINGRLYVSWPPMLEEYRRGVALYLTKTLKPGVVNPRAPTEETKETYLIPVLLLGEEPKEQSD